MAAGNECVFISFRFINGCFTFAGVTVRSLGRITAANSYFFLCDMQEKFVPSIKYFPAITTVASKMVSQ